MASDVAPVTPESAILQIYVDALRADLLRRIVTAVSDAEIQNLATGVLADIRAEIAVKKKRSVSSFAQEQTLIEEIAISAAAQVARDLAKRFIEEARKDAAFMHDCAVQVQAALAERAVAEAKKAGVSFSTY